MQATATKQQFVVQAYYETIDMSSNNTLHIDSYIAKNIVISTPSYLNL